MLIEVVLLFALVVVVPALVAQCIYHGGRDD